MINRPYRTVSRTEDCPVCGATLGATVPVYLGETAPVITFRHNPDGTHEPELTGTGTAARARAQGHIIGSDRRTLH